jgi:glycosyltransferase involved in cell wall biosynthesis
MEERLREQLPPGAEMLGYLPRQDLYEHMARAHCLLVTSVREGWGMVITEANSVGTPAVGYDVPGIRDAIRDGVTGLLADPSGPARIADLCVGFVVDDARYTAACHEAAAWATSLSWGRTARSLMDLILEQNLTDAGAMASATPSADTPVVRISR